MDIEKVAERHGLPANLVSDLVNDSSPPPMFWGHHHQREAAMAIVHHARGEAAEAASKLENADSDLDYRYGRGFDLLPASY